MRGFLRLTAELESALGFRCPLLWAVLEHLPALVGAMNDDVPPDDESPIDEWMATGHRRGVVEGAALGVACGALAVGVVAVIGWLL